MTILKSLVLNATCFEAVGYIYIYAHVDTSICILFMTFKLSNIWTKCRIFECLWSYQY